MDKINLEAYAKINLGLDVLRRREDGYHEVYMIMQTIDLHDDILLEKTGEKGIWVETDLEGIPVNEDNLVYKAAKLLMDEFSIAEGVKINLKKNIPVAAGMAGGSADAAAVLKGVNELFALGLSKEDLMKRGVAIGADVPYCIMQGTALAEGIGEVLTPLPAMPACHILIAKPPIDVSTKFVYTNLKANELERHPDIDGQIKAIRTGNLQIMCETMGNVLETVTVPAYPVIGEIKDIMKEQGAVNAMMSGSGPTVFGIFEKQEDAEATKEKLQNMDADMKVFVTAAWNQV